jgi:8-oxo-dGTP pyrophosphatase MutT (NUDIX family)
MPDELRDGESRNTEWVTHGERTVYSSDWLDLRLVDVTSPDGRRFEHHVVRMHRVAVAAVLDEAGDHLLMLHRHRFIDQSWGWEVPVGIVESGEDSWVAAVREVEEETGWRPERLELLLSFQPAIGIADTPHDVYVGQGARRIGEPTDLTEAGRIAWLPVSDLESMVRQGQIRDGATLVAVLHVLASRGGS